MPPAPHAKPSASAPKPSKNSSPQSAPAPRSPSANPSAKPTPPSPWAASRQEPFDHERTSRLAAQDRAATHRPTARRAVQRNPRHASRGGGGPICRHHQDRKSAGEGKDVHER